MYEKQRQMHEYQEGQQRQMQRAHMQYQFAPGIVEMYSQRRREVFKLILTALTIALGVSIYWFGKKVFSDVVFRDSSPSQWSSQQTIMANACLPLSIVVLIWTVKVFWMPQR